jgi:hypothetical protein
LRIAVVGGGIAGLGVASRLAEWGHAVTLFERRACIDAEQEQSALLGSYRSLGDLLRRAQAISALRATPLDQLAGLAGLRALGLFDRARLFKVVAAIGRPSALFPAASDFETVDRWLDRIGQSAGARAGFWYPLCEQALGDSANSASAKLLESVLREAFFAKRSGSPLGLWRVTLSPAWAELAARYLEEKGGRVVTAARVTTIDVGGSVPIARALVLHGGERHEADAIVLALPPADVFTLIPEAQRRENYFDALTRLPRATSSVAVLAHPAGSEGDRPLARSPIEGLYLAGAHLRTGLPSTMESAARSADDAAQLVDAYRPVRPVEPTDPNRASGSFIPVSKLRRPMSNA